MARKPGPKAKTGPKKKPAPRGVSTSVLADILGLSEARLGQLVDIGMPKAGRGLFPMRDATRWYVEFLRKGGEKPAATGPTLADAQRDLALLKVKKAQGEVFDRQEVVGTMNAAYERLGASHEQLATKISRELNLSTDDAKMVRDMVDEMRRKFVNDCAEFIEVVEDGQPGAIAAA